MIVMSTLSDKVIFITQYYIMYNIYFRVCELTKQLHENVENFMNGIVWHQQNDHLISIPQDSQFRWI